MTRLHDEAFLASIREIPALTDATFDGEVVGRPQRWANVHSNRGVPRPDRFAQPQGGRIRKSFFVQSVGVSKKQADAVAERIAAKLTGSRLTVAGWSCERISHESSQPTQKDETVSPPLYIAVDTYDFDTEPEPATP